MKGILVFSRRDWLHPKAGPIEDYVHQVFSRIAAQGNYVAVVCQRHPLLRPRRPQTERVDEIQIARLGSPLLHGVLVGMFLSRLGREEGLTSRLDVAVDCVSGKPLPVAAHVDVPVVPVVFNLARRVRVSDTPPGPMVAATEQARDQLQRRGLSENFVVYAPYGVDTALFRPSPESTPSPTLVALENAPACLRKALAILAREGINIQAEVRGRHAHWFHRGAVAHEERPRERAALYAHAWLGYCGPGHEGCALEMGAAGLPVIGPATDAGRAAIEEGATGLRFAPGNAEQLAACLRRLLKDEMLRRRLSVAGREHAEGLSWDRTASLVLATIENLEPRGE